MRGRAQAGGWRDSVGGSLVSKTSNETAAPEPREKFIPLRKSDIVAALVAHAGLPADQALGLRRFARMLGVMFAASLLAADPDGASGRGARRWLERLIATRQPG